VARAKQTGRAEARRRYRQAAIETVEPEAGADLDAGERRPVAGPKPSGRGARTQSAPTGRVGFMDAFRLAYHPAHVVEDIRALPQLLRSRAFLAAAGLLLVGGAAWLLFPLRSGSVLLWELLVVPGSALAPQLVAGFFAPRASYLLGFLIGIVQTIVFILVSMSPSVVAAYAALGADAVPQIRPEQVAQAFLSASVTGALFAAAAAWYRRFLALSSPRRAPAGRSGAPRRASR
jgi:hypothetical protein